MVDMAGLEPVTSRVGVLAFYQLNYTPIVFNYYIILFLKRKG